MKQAFAYSLLLHIALVLIVIIIANVSFKIDKKEMIQLSMEVFNNNEGTGNAARGIETSNSNVNINSKANAMKNAQNNIVEKTEETVEKVEKEVKKVDNTKQMAMQEKMAKKRKNKEEKKEEKKERKRQKQQMQSSEGAIMAAKGKSSGKGAGTKGKSDGAPKSHGGVDGVFTLKEVDNIPKALKSARPVYPEYAKNMRIEGFVKIRFIVDKDGNTISHKIVKAEPKKVFENAAIKAVEQWKFKPAVKDGENVKVAMVVKLNFKLDEK